ncbi:aldo/keto reductase [Psychrobacillus lasiicapitis]|uniref:Aldo/keto reductase n=1 Tax=Psychrobacillus lasiicapitis TaxID=1636719 RepID=A0A544THX7_9BACI|nr:aldo/keto reductase [Psychrobacillus lasiicapitis]TQR17018.1 aldo/keto reductase [Psychrobacillus lasiicapitis]GGA25222.1 putative oxidoreductase YqkF [Psychrobacillus lasiicapitis]
MKKRQLGNSKILVSEIGFGCMSLPTGQQEAEKIIQVALEHGINYFDTADLYNHGENEKIVGNALKNNRERIILATKVGNRMNENGDGWSWDPSKKWITTAIHESLKRLQTDYIDVYQLHGGTMEDDTDEVIDTMETLKKEGLIREYGISSIRPNVIDRFLKNSNAVSVMMQYSLLDRRPEEWLPLLEEHQVSLLTRGTLAKGLLTAEGLERANKTGEYLTYSSEELLKTIKQLEALDAPINAIALHHVLKQKDTGSMIIGASSIEQLLETLEAYNTEVSEDVLVKARDITKQDVYTEHRA